VTATLTTGAGSGRVERAPLIRGVPGETLGPLARIGAQTFVFLGLFVAFAVEGFEILPGLAPLVLGLGVLPILVLTPTRVSSRLPISLLVLTLLAWQVASVLWTASPQGTANRLLLSLPITLGFMLVTGVIALKDLVPALLWSIRFSVVFTAVVIATVARARVHVDPLGVQPDFPGWHGFFPHKNVMGPYFVFCLVSILTFDRTKIIRPVMVGAIGVMLAFSTSITGQTGALLAVSIWVWVQLYRNLELRNSSIFLISTVSVAAFGALGVLASISSIIGASGRDVTFTGRTFIWSATLEAWARRPLTGYGLSGVLGRVPITSTTATIWRDVGFEVPHAHNGVIDIGLQLGLVGVALYVLLFVTTLIDGFRLLRDRPKLAAWIVSVMLVQLYMSISEPVFMASGWLPVLIMFRILLLRKEGLDFDAGTQLADRVRRVSSRSHRAHPGRRNPGTSSQPVPSRP
jgi:exopolysaccharide production protein ExoQ